MLLEATVVDSAAIMIYFSCFALPITLILIPPCSKQ